jgi:hypothetical protein
MGKTTAEIGRGNGKQKCSSRALEDCFVALVPYTEGVDHKHISNC